MENVRIEEVREANECYVKAIQSLLAQLTTTPVEFTMQQLDLMVKNEASRLFVILLDDEIAGMLTLGTYLSPTGPKIWVEDVVVDQQHRGHSLGRKLMDFAIAEARQCDGAQLMLTSKPARVAANALYQGVGFQKKETNVYRMTFGE